MHSDDLRAVVRSIAANVRRLREQRGLSQEQLGEAAGIDAKSVQRLERGTGNPTVHLLASVADALGVKPGSLFEDAPLEPRTVGRPRKSKTAMTGR